jgi:hypothetical protein
MDVFLRGQTNEKYHQLRCGEAGSKKIMTAIGLDFAGENINVGAGLYVV